MESAFNESENKAVKVRVQTNGILHEFLLLYACIGQNISKSSLNLRVLVKVKNHSTPLLPFLTFFIIKAGKKGSELVYCNYYEFRW